MAKSITLLGSTGSIGRQTLEVAQACGLTVAALTANPVRDALVLVKGSRGIGLERALPAL